jgi:hypothetical protein
MSFQLLLKPHTIAAWGLRQGMRFARCECDEFLFNLFLYTSRQRGKRWVAIPIYREEKRQPYENHVDIVFEQDGLETTWAGYFTVLFNMHDDRMYDRNNIHALMIRFGQKETPSSRVHVEYMICTETLQGLYYIKVLDWYTRCSTMHECIALFDLIECNAEKLAAMYSNLWNCKGTIFHLSRKIPHQHDPILLASMQRKLQLMRQDIDGMKCIVLQSAHPSTPAPSSRKPYSSVAGGACERSQ